MATEPNDFVIRHYVTSLCNGGLETRPRGGTVMISREGELVYHRTSGQNRNAWGPVILCHYSHKEKVFVINGDGFTDNSATRWQTQIRSLVQGTMRGGGARFPVNAAGNQYILAPFAALAAAGIDLDSIKPIDVQPDRWENVWHPTAPRPDLPKVPPGRRNLPKWWQIRNDGDRNRVYEITVKGTRFRVRAYQRQHWVHKTTGKRGYRYSNNRNEYEQAWEWTWNGSIEVWGVPERSAEGAGAGQWHNPQQLGRTGTPNGQTIRVAGETQSHRSRADLNLPPESWGWVERVHHLGASVFSAKTNGRRHRFISGFDELEIAQPMYYLAQLPDKVDVPSYIHAIEALAPPIVHKAWADGIPVYRQGDIFAIQTKLTDEQVYERAVTRVRREVVLATINAQTLARAITDGRKLPEPAEKEVRERIDCPCGCGHRRWSGIGPKAHAALSIYRTGHTATEVVNTVDGTFVRGIMYHDPFIEEPGRTAEHRQVTLGDGKAWHLCTRNTVPRRRRVRQPQQEGAATT